MTSSASCRWRRAIAGALTTSVAPAASASFLSGEALDTMADWIAIIVLIVVPIGAIVLFWLVHILPEKVAEKRHHPQKAAITTLCLLSLVFGGLLWPIAWLWAYTRPIGYKLAYGTEKHEDYFDEMTTRVRGGKLVAHDIDHLRDELDAMAAKGALPPRLRQLRAELGALSAQTLEAPAAGGKA
jgi:CBS domain containing-hemolysin-like protein